MFRRSFRLSAGLKNRPLSASVRLFHSDGRLVASPFRRSYSSYFFPSFVGGLGLAAVLGFYSLENSPQQDRPVDAEGFPLYTLAEVSAHNSPSVGVWVHFEGAVYDISNFLAQHPGGREKILMAAGGSIEPFWAIYQQHKHENVRKILKELRIGSLLRSAEEPPPGPSDDPFSREPKRHSALIVSAPKPFNAEPPSDILSASFLTPEDFFFVRNHLPVPLIAPEDAETFSVALSGPNKREVKISVGEIKNNFPKHSVVSVLQCAGNRRSELHALKPIKGLGWSVGAISNAKWTGARLRDLLNKSGLSEEEILSGAVQHVQFEGADHDPTGTPYGSSIPISKALDPDTILAYEMNDRPLSRDHGFPIRVIAPGIVAARQVKWLNKIILSPVESSSHWQQNDYKSFSPSVDWDSVKFDSAPAIQEMPVQSAICEPRNLSRIEIDQTEVFVRGYAWSGGGRGIIRVDLSADEGKSWQTAELQPLYDLHSREFHANRVWSWTPFNATVQIPLKAGETSVKLLCRAVDSSYNSQPDSLEGQWNLRGVVNNAWHKITLERAESSDSDE